MEVQRITEARAGFEHWTLRCTRCGRIEQAQVNTDPLKSEALGWTQGAKSRRPPVEQPTKFEFVLNPRSAGAIGLTVPPMPLARATRVIE